MFKKKELTRLGDVLVDKGIINKAQLDIAIQEQSRRKKLLDPSDITAKVAPIGEILIELGFIDQLQLKRGLNWQQRLRHASIAMALCAPFMMFAPSAAASIVRPAPITVEAENYSAMLGVVKENTTDVGAGKNLGAISTGDWMSYSVDVPAAGNYKIIYRVATPNATAKFVLKSGTDADLAAAVSVPKTGGWQVWTDVEQTVSLQKGVQTLKIYAQVGGFNLNWFKIANIDPAPEPEAISKLIEAESYSSMSGVVPEATADTGGGQSVGYIATGDWMNYENADLIIPKTGTYKISYRVANLNEGGVLLLKNIVSGTVIDTVTVPKTGGWQTWATVERTVTLEQGLTKLQVYAQSGGFNINWLKVESVEAEPVAPSASETVFPLVIQSESYSEMLGIRTETTTDVGGGMAVGYVDTGDSMSYSTTSVRAPFTGKYKVSYRVSSLNGGASLALNEYGTTTTLGTVDIPKTGGWQQWVTIDTEVTLTEGEHKFAVLAKTGGANINWIQIEPISTPLPLTVQAEDYSTMSGVRNEITTDVGGGSNVAYVDAGDWMAYNNVEVLIPNTAQYKISYRVASNVTGATLELYSLDSSKVFDSAPIPNSAGWQKWITVERTITLPAGKHHFGIKAPNGGFNVNWFKLEKVGATGSVSSSSSSSSAPVVSSVSTSKSSAPSVAVSSSSSSSTPAVASSSWSSSSAAAHVAGSVEISWTAPTKRENGADLYIDELGGYEIRYKKTTDTKYTYVSINDPWTQSYKFDWLEGDYVFQIAAFDKNGIYSPFEDIQRE
ncbi:MAG: hypothetical protein K0Q67_2720 [Cellvibrio sp.]|nr:hypothetical protein [Cellvibrio sp.]